MRRTLPSILVSVSAQPHLAEELSTPKFVGRRKTYLGNFLRADFGKQTLYLNECINPGDEYNPLSCNFVRRANFVSRSATSTASIVISVATSLLPFSRQQIGVSGESPPSIMDDSADFISAFNFPACDTIVLVTGRAEFTSKNRSQFNTLPV